MSAGQRVVFFFVLIFFLPEPRVLVLSQAFRIELGFLFCLALEVWFSGVLFVLAWLWEIAIAAVQQWVLIAVAALAALRNVGFLSWPILLHGAFAGIFIVSVRSMIWHK
jgi:hypothetical protein